MKTINKMMLIPLFVGAILIGKWAATPAEAQNIPNLDECAMPAYFYFDEMLQQHVVVCPSTPTGANYSCARRGCLIQ